MGDDRLPPPHRGPEPDGQAPEDSEVTQRQPTMKRDPRVDYVGPTPDGFFQPEWPAPETDNARHGRSGLVAAVVLVLVLVVGGGAVAVLALTRDDARSTVSDGPPATPGAEPRASDLTNGLWVTGRPTRRQALLVAYTFLDHVKNRDCEAALAMTARLQDNDPVISHIGRDYLCVGRVANATRDGFRGSPVLNRFGDSYTVDWNDNEHVQVDLVDGYLQVTWFNADIYR